MKAEEVPLMEGFKRFNFDIKSSDYPTFGWYGYLQVLFRDEVMVVSARGIPIGDNGDFRFFIHEPKFTQSEADEIEVIGYKYKYK